MHARVGIGWRALVRSAPQVRANAPKINWLNNFATKKKKNGEFGESSTIYYLPNEVEQYKTADQIYVAWMEQVCGVKS